MRLSERILGLVLILAGLLSLLLLVPGILWQGGVAPLRFAFGWGAFILAPALLLGGVLIVVSVIRGRRIPWIAVALAEAGTLALLILVHMAMSDRSQAVLDGSGGGVVGWAGSELLVFVAGPRVAWGIAVAFAAVTVGLLWRALLHPDAPLLPPPPGGRLGRKPLRGTAGAIGSFLRNGASALASVPSRVLRVFGTGPGVPSLPHSDARGDAPASERVQSAPLAPRRASGHPSAPRADASASPPAPSTVASSQARERPMPPRPRSSSLPPLDLLRPDQEGGSGNADVRHRAQVLKETLAEFGVPVEIVSIKEGPTVTQFGLEPGEIVKELRSGEIQRRRVSVHSIMRLNNDLALALAAHSLRIEAPVPGRPYVGIEVPNPAKTLVSLRSILECKEFAKTGAALPVALGRDVSGDPVIADLTAMPHLLIAGATGAGKSVCINALICSLLMNKGPERVRLVMVDPKMVELPAYNGIPHLIGNVITDPLQVPGALAWLTLQMDDRYRLFSNAGVRNIAQYNRKFAKTRAVAQLPYLILAIDEMADLMMTAAYDIERQICRLAQMSRATGIHLILATQRPSVDVITGLIKANFPARIAFAVTTQVDSRVILDVPGADKLLGRGDMLYMAPDSSKLARVQGCFVSDREIDALVGFWKATRPEDEKQATRVPPWELMEAEEEPTDELLDQALALLSGKRTISTSTFQRQLRLGFPRAARLMEQLEAMGAVGPDEGGGRSRAVLASRASVTDDLD